MLTESIKPRVGKEYSFVQLKEMGFNFPRDRFTTAPRGPQYRELISLDGSVSVFTAHIPGKPYTQTDISQTVAAVFDLPSDEKSSTKYIQGTYAELGPKVFGWIPGGNRLK